jgi:hypothetical protein
VNSWVVKKLKKKNAKKAQKRKSPQVWSDLNCLDKMQKQMGHTELPVSESKSINNTITIFSYTFARIIICALKISLLRPHL